jgi:hypothetical protein
MNVAAGLGSRKPLSLAAPTFACNGPALIGGVVATLFRDLLGIVLLNKWEYFPEPIDRRVAEQVGR